jgi:hypothetical protein
MTAAPRAVEASHRPAMFRRGCCSQRIENGRRRRLRAATYPVGGAVLKVERTARGATSWPPARGDGKVLRPLGLQKLAIVLRCSVAGVFRNHSRTSAATTARRPPSRLRLCSEGRRYPRGAF